MKFAPGDLGRSRYSKDRISELLFNTPKVSSVDDISDEFQSDELCMVIAIHANKLFILTSQQHLGWKSENEFEYL
jgi:hypothetical protein